MSKSSLPPNTLELPRNITINVFPTRVEAILSIRRKNPNFDFPYGTSLHRNLAIPREAEKTDVPKVMIVWFGLSELNSMLFCLGSHLCVAVLWEKPSKLVLKMCHTMPQFHSNKFIGTV